MHSGGGLLYLYKTSDNVWRWYEEDISENHNKPEMVLSMDEAAPPAKSCLCTQRTNTY